MLNLLVTVSDVVQYLKDNLAIAIVFAALIALILVVVIAMICVAVKKKKSQEQYGKRGNGERRNSPPRSGT